MLISKFYILMDATVIEESLVVKSLNMLQHHIILLTDTVDEDKFPETTQRIYTHRSDACSEPTRRVDDRKLKDAEVGFGIIFDTMKKEDRKSIKREIEKLAQGYEGAVAIGMKGTLAWDPEKVILEAGSRFPGRVCIGVGSEDGVDNPSILEVAKYKILVGKGAPEGSELHGVLDEEEIDEFLHWYASLVGPNLEQNKCKRARNS